MPGYIQYKLDLMISSIYGFGPDSFIFIFMMNVPRINDNFSLFNESFEEFSVF